MFYLNCWHLIQDGSTVMVHFLPFRIFNQITCWWQVSNRNQHAMVTTCKWLILFGRDPPADCANTIFKSRHCEFEIIYTCVSVCTIELSLSSNEVSQMFGNIANKSLVSLQCCCCKLLTCDIMLWHNLMWNGATKRILVFFRNDVCQIPNLPSLFVMVERWHNGSVNAYISILSMKSSTYKCTNTFTNQHHR